MTSRTTMALMAAALILAVQGHPRAQSPDCPCGDPADLVPLAKWPTDVADCSANPTRVALYGFSFEGGIVSVSSTVYGRDCQYVVDASDLDVHEQPISQPQVEACSGLILNYAQALKNAGQVAVGDFGCNLR
ncbi:MAG: hypothetical protein IIA72_11790 [Proteobacteria bacterium]|nr:hypothetical protein [Pseudomonadota bacterium]